MPSSGPPGLGRCAAEAALRDRIFVFAGRLQSLSQADAADMVRRAGGVIRSSVTRDTSFLVAAEPHPFRGAGAAGESGKVRAAARLNAEGRTIRVLTEDDFLRLMGLEVATELGGRYYTAADIRNLYELDSAALRQLERLRVVHPALRTHADRYYTFQDLLVLRQVHEARASGCSLTAIARRLRLERCGQIRLRFEDVESRVVELRQPEEENLTAEDWYELGCDCDEEEMDLSRAMIAYERALELDAHHVGALVNLGNVYYRMGQIDEARRLYDRALAIDPQNPNVHYNLGNVYDDLEEHRTAIRFFESALKLRPGNADAHFNLGLVHDRLGNVEKVRRHMQAYLRLDPEGEMADTAREYLHLTACEDGAPA